MSIEHLTLANLLGRGADC